jgi:hypothetical protein
MSDSGGCADVSVEKAAKQAGIVVRALSRMYVAAAPRQGLLLGFSGYPRQVIAPALMRFALKACSYNSTTEWFVSVDAMRAWSSSGGFISYIRLAQA